MTKYYLLFENGKEASKGFIQPNLDAAFQTKDRLEKEHKPRKWFIVEVEATGLGYPAYDSNL